MAQYDGAIRIGTEITTKDARKELKELEHSIKNSASEISGLEKEMESVKTPTEQYASLRHAINSNKTALEALVNEQKKLSENGIGKEIDKEYLVASEAVKRLKADLQQAVKARDKDAYLGIEDRLNRAKSVLQGMMSENPRPLGDISYYYAIDKKISDLKNNISSTEAEIKKLEESGKAFTLGEGAEEKAARIKELTEQMAADKQRQSELQSALAEREERIAQIRENAVVGNQRIVEVMERRRQLAQEIADMEQAGVGVGYRQHDTAKQELASLDQEIKNYADGVEEVKESYGRLGQTAKKAFSIAHSAISKAGSGLKRFGGFVKSVFSNLTKSAHKSNSSFGALGVRFKSLALSLLIFNQISKAFNAMISGMKQGFGNLYNEVSSFKSAVDGLKASSLTLKNSFAAAFRPLMELAIPYIQQAIDSIANLMNMIGQFTAAITGQKTYTKAIKQTTAAIEDENKAQKKQLSGLDKLNNLSSDSGGGAGGEASGQMFEEEVPIESGILGAFHSLKDLIESEDWEGLGAYIAGALNQGLQKIYDVINWENVGPYITSFIDAFSGTINGLVDKFDWDLLGRTVGAGINTLVNTFNQLFDKINFENLGAKLSVGIRGAIDEIDWNNLGNLIGNKFMVAWQIAEGFVNDMWRINPDTLMAGWKELGVSLGNALNGIVEKIDLASIGETLGKALTGIFQTAISFADTFGWKSLGTNIYQGINSFFANTEWDKVGKGLSDFALGLLDSLIIAIEGTNWQQIGESIADFILNVDWLGIAARLLVVGQDLSFGILEGILSVFGLSELAGWLRDNVFDPFVNSIKDLFGIHSPSTVMAEIGKFLMEGLFNGISALVDNVISIFTTIKEKISEVWEEVKQVTSDIWKSIKQKINDAWNGIKSLVSTAINNVKNTISNVWNTIKTTTRNVWNGIKSIFNGFMTFLTGVFTGNWEKAWGGIVKIFEGVKTSIKSVINGILGLVESLANGVINGINFVIGALNGISFDIPDWLKYVPGASFFAGKTFGFNIPELEQVSIPRLATGTVVPPNNEFLSVLGDNKREPEVVSPLSTIEQAVENAMRRNGGMGSGEITIKIPVEIDGNILFELIQKLDLEQYNRTKRPSFQI